MRCPNCDVNLMMMQRAGLSIDICAKCHGAWLDKEELDTVLEAQTGVSVRTETSPPPAPNGHSLATGNEYKKKSRGSHFNDLLDF